MRRILLISFAIVIFLFLFVSKTSSALAQEACTISPSEIYDNTTSQSFKIDSGGLLNADQHAPKGVNAYFSNSTDNPITDFTRQFFYYKNDTGKLGIADDGAIYMMGSEYSANFVPDQLKASGGKIYVLVNSHGRRFSLCNPIELKIKQYIPPNPCRFTYTDSDRPNKSISSLTQKLNIDVTSNNLISSEKYSIRTGDDMYGAAPLLKAPPWILLQRDISINNGKLSASWNFAEDIYTEPNHLKAGKQLKTTVYYGSNTVCSDTVDVSGPPPEQEGLCTLSFNNGSNIINTFKPDDPIKFIANFPNVDNPTHRVLIQRINDNDMLYGAKSWDKCYQQSDLSDSNPSDSNPPGISTRTLPAGYSYYLQVNSQCAPFNESFSCGQKFDITKDGGGLDGDPIDTDTLPIENFVKTPCSDYQKDDKENLIGCNSVFSGLGVSLSTNPLKLIPQIIEVILAIAGAIVIILIIRAGYKLMFSQGNPEKVQEAKDELTSAIVGLLFIIFSFVLLQFITNDLLKIQDLPKGEGLKTE